jgi:hypothetical protein
MIGLSREIDAAITGHGWRGQAGLVDRELAMYYRAAM